MKGSETYDKEKASFNLAKIKKAGERFEIMVEPDKAIAFRNGSVADVSEVLMYEKVFSDAKKGMQSPDASLERAFSTTDPLKIAEVILKEGDVHLTSEYRASQREAKHRQLVQLIHRNSIDPRTNLPHPITRIENAFAEAKVRIDESKRAEDQLDDVIKKLQPVLPIRFETRKLQVLIPSQYAPKSYPILKSFGRLVKDKWHSDGTLMAVIELPAGLQQDLTDQLNKVTRGDVDIKNMEEK